MCVSGTRAYICSHMFWLTTEPNCNCPLLCSCVFFFTFAHILRCNRLLCLFCWYVLLFTVTNFSQMHVFACDNFTILALFVVVCCVFCVGLLIFMFVFLSLHYNMPFVVSVFFSSSVCLLMQILTILLLIAVCRFLNRTRLPTALSLPSHYIHTHTYIHTIHTIFRALHTLASNAAARVF